MEKKLFYYEDNAEFEENKETLDLLSHYAAYENIDNDINFRTQRIDPMFKPTIESVAGDIAAYDSELGYVGIIDKNAYDVDVYPSERFTPVGVVVVPASHVDDGTAKIISLKSMDYNNPDSGNESGNIGIGWGGYGYDVPGLDYKTMYPAISEDIRVIEGEQAITGWYYFSQTLENLPSDHFNSYPNPYDEGTFYMTGTTTSSNEKAMPSPYLTGGLKNEIYHSMENSGNALTDMDGRVNTAAILSVDNGAGTDWQTAETINHMDNIETIHPAAQCCWRYHTTGTTQGEWYFPAAGELGYLVARWDAIAASFAKIRDAGFVAVSLPVGSRHWSSTECSFSSTVILYFGSNYATFYTVSKDLTGYARAFIAVP